MKIRAITFPRPMGNQALNLTTWDIGYSSQLPIEEGDYLAVHNASFSYPSPEDLTQHPRCAVIGVVKFGGFVLNPCHGKYEWLIKNPVRIAPVYTPGHRGLWQLREEVLNQVRANYLNASTLQGAV